MKLFNEYSLRTMTLKNRLVMAPMCMYQVVKEDGLATDFHFAHYVSRAIGQVGLIIVEATGVTPNGRITDTDLGLWNDSQIEPLKRIVDAVHEQGSKIAIQLSHAGRKSMTKNCEHFAPSVLESNQNYMPYKEMSKREIHEIITDFKEAAIRADKAGFDGIELHGAHGYLLHEFLSPLSNQRSDEFGKDRNLFLKELLNEIHSVWPREKELWIRVSATDYHENGLKPQDVINTLLEVKDQLDLVHVSSGGVISTKIPLKDGYQLDLAKEIKEKVGLPTIGVGLINDPNLFISALEDDYCDLVASGRELLRNPFIMLEMLKTNDLSDKIPFSYYRAYK